MKLPGINYNTPVKKLERVDRSLSMNLTNAQNRAVTQLGEASVGIYNQVEEQRALNYWAQTSREMNDLETDFKSRPATSDKSLKEEYDKSLSQMKVGAEKELGGKSLQIWQGKFGKKSEETRFKLTTGNALELAKQERTNTKSNNMETAKTDLPAAIEANDDSPLFSDLEKKEERQNLININEKAQVEDALYSDNPDLIQAQIDRLSKGDTVLDEKDTRKRIGWLETAKTKALADTVAAAAGERERRASDLELAVDSGQAGPNEIEAAFTNKDQFGESDITGPKRTQLIKNWRDLQKEGAKISIQDANLSKLLASGTPADPKDKDMIAAIDRRYDDAYEQVQNAPPVQKQQLQKQLDEAGIDLAIRTNILPEKMKSNIRTFAMTGSPESVNRQVNIFESLQKAAPNSINGIDPNTRSIYEQTSAMTRGGRDIAEAVEIARKNVLAPPEVKAAYREAYADLDDSPTERLADLFADDDQFSPDFFGFSPKPTPIQAGMYKSIEYADFQNNGGDIEQAQATASRELKRILSRTELADPEGKNKVMAYAPEREYGLPAEEIKRQLTAYVKKNNKPNPEMAIIASDGITGREEAKTYIIWYEDENGFTKQMENPDGRPSRWAPSVKDYRDTERAKDEAAAAKKQAIIEEGREAIDDEDFDLGGAGGQVKPFKGVGF